MSDRFQLRAVDRPVNMPCNLHRLRDTVDVRYAPSSYPTNGWGYLRCSISNCRHKQRCSATNSALGLRATEMAQTKKRFTPRVTLVRQWARGRARQVDGPVSKQRPECTRRKPNDPNA